MRPLGGFGHDPRVCRAIAAEAYSAAESPLQLREDPAHAGVYFAVDAPEFNTHAAGQIVRFAAEPSLPADKIAVTYVTPRSTRDGRLRVFTPGDPDVA